MKRLEEAQERYASGDHPADIRKMFGITIREFQEKVVAPVQGNEPGKPIVLYSTAAVWAARALR